MAAVTTCSDFGAQNNKVCHCFHCFPFYLPWSDGTRCHDLIFFWMLSFKTTFSLSSFTFTKGLFSSSSLSAIRVVSSAYLRLLIFLLAILIPAGASSSPTFLMPYSAYKLNKQGDNIQPWRTPFPIWNQSVVPCPVLTVASWPTFLRRQGRLPGIPISFRINSTHQCCYKHNLFKAHIIAAISLLLCKLQGKEREWVGGNWEGNTLGPTVDIQGLHFYRNSKM